MVLRSSFRSCWLLALPAFSLLMAPAAAQNPAGIGPATPNPGGPATGAPSGGDQQVPGALAPGGPTGQAAPAETRLAKLAPSQPDEHPLMPALRWAYDGVGNIEKLRDYSATMVKRERVNGKVGEPEYMFVKVRHEPFSVYMYECPSQGLPGSSETWIVTDWPALPFTIKNGRAERFCPKSATYSPTPRFLKDTAFRVSATVIGGQSCSRSTPPGPSTTRTACHCASSKSGLSQPGCSSRAS